MLHPIHVPQMGQIVGSGTDPHPSSDKGPVPAFRPTKPFSLLFVLKGEK